MCWPYLNFKKEMKRFGAYKYHRSAAIGGVPSPGSASVKGFVTVDVHSANGL